MLYYYQKILKEQRIKRILSQFKSSYLENDDGDEEEDTQSTETTAITEKDRKTSQEMHSNFRFFDSIIELSDFAVQNETQAWSKLKLLPKFLLKLKPENEEEVELKEKRDANIKFLNKDKVKLDKIIKELQLLLAQFFLYLEKKGKMHLSKDCILDKTSGSIVFLSFEALVEFIKFVPNIKIHLRCNDPKQAQHFLDKVKNYDVFSNIKNIQIISSSQKPEGTYGHENKIKLKI